MIQLSAFQNNPQQGEIRILMRFDGKFIYLKTNQAPQKNQMIEQLKSGGASIEESISGWLKIDMFHTHKFARFGTYEIDSEEESDELIESQLSKFYEEKYLQAKFDVQLTKI